MKKFLLFLLFAQEVCLGQTFPEPEVGTFAGQAIDASVSQEQGLLFYLSGENGFTAGFAAGGQDKPNFLKGLKIIEDGAIGSAFEATDDQLMSYWAPGNIFAQRGTISFFWRSRYPVGPTPFPVFRVGYADHTSWDMAWLRIDYNGAGFDAFVTDVGLARTRVSYYTDDFPAPNQWTHIAFSWDETEGVRLYINGELVKKQSTEGRVFDTGLDQFGPHSRIISPYQVQSAYNFMRGGDLDELRIHDRMLSDDNIEQLVAGKTPLAMPVLHRDFKERQWRDEWWVRHGWNLPNDPPPLLSAKNITIRKVGIHDAYDVKRWTWKANDGIRETTWPGVYNMSRIPGRYDYFVYPDWDCYSVSGQSINFLLPDEPWNHVEIWGKAWGQLTYEKDHAYDRTFGVKSNEQIKSFHRLKEPETGGQLRFDNALIEEPIGELGVYYVHEGNAPANAARETFALYAAGNDVQDESLTALSGFIDGRYPVDERTKMIGITKGEKFAIDARENNNSLPFIHILIPYENSDNNALDGIEIELPPLAVNPSHHGVFPMNIRIKDPLWPMRDLADFSFSVKPKQSHTLWIDTRDHILPEDQALYITLAGADHSLSQAALEGAKISMIYKSVDEAKPEHELDRFTQVRDLYSHLVEEHPSSPRLNLYNRFNADLSDLLKVNPQHWLGRAYKYATTNNIEDRPEYEIKESPKGIPAWAFLQTEYLRHVEKIIDFYIDKRQIGNGEFGGGLSDDDDFANLFVASALMGIEPEKIKKSLRLYIEGYYNQDRDPYNAALKQPSLPLFTNGLATIRGDELHSFEEGIQAVGQLMMVDYGNPLYFNRGMEIAKRILEDITKIAPDGHRHFQSRYYSGTDISKEDPWQWSQNYSHLVLQSALMIARYNGNPALRNMIIEIADGLLAHRDEEDNMYTEINFTTGEVRGQTGVGRAWPVFMAAFEYTGDSTYLAIIPEKNRKFREFDKEAMVSFYSNQIKEKGVKMYIETEGSIWIDRVKRDNPLIQEHRLGGVALIRANDIYPRHYVSWNIHKPANYESMAFFVPYATSKNINIIAYNLEKIPVESSLAVWNIQPGTWRMVQGVDTDDDQQIDSKSEERTVYLERGSDLELTFTSRENTIVNMELIKPAETDYWERSDLAIGISDIKIVGDKVIIQVHNLGAIESPETNLELRDGNGELVKEMSVPSLSAPLDLIPKWVEISIGIPAGTDLTNGRVEVDPDKEIVEITRKNNTVSW